MTMMYSFEKSIERSMNIVKYNIGKLEYLYKVWNKHLPGIRPYYAVKCNNNPQIITRLAELGCGFDCASQKEMELVKKYALESNNNFKMSDDIIFANPCKYMNEVKWANDNQIKMTVFDSVYEIEKFGEKFKGFDYILRIYAKDEQASCQMDKYGALENEWEYILEKCENLGINLVGVSFHVGSDAKQSSAYEKAIKNASTVFEMAKYYGFHNLNVLDIGGGFSEETIQQFGPIIMQCIKDNFGKNKNQMKLIAEPGRYFAANIATLYTQIVGKRIRNAVTQYYVSVSLLNIPPSHSSNGWAACIGLGYLWSKN